MVRTASLTHQVAAGPVLKWAGGKTQLLGHILPQLPNKAKTYYEPFIGGGAVFFAMANQRRFERAVIADKNIALVEMYRVIRDDLDSLVGCLAEHQQYATDSDYFYHMRAKNPDELSLVERVGRTMFLNKTCFNGLYRVNKKGQFNVPFGKYKNPKVLNEPKLQAASKALQGVEIRHSDFSDIAKEAGKGDAIYFDPPYVPLSDSSSFTAYHNSPFGPKQHETLAKAYQDCCKRGATAVLSNSDCEYTREIYGTFEVETVGASRAINSKASGRGRVNEVLVVGLKSRARPSLVRPADSSVSAAKTFLRRQKRQAVSA